MKGRPLLIATPTYLQRLSANTINENLHRALLYPMKRALPQGGIRYLGEDQTSHHLLVSEQSKNAMDKSEIHSTTG